MSDTRRRAFTLLEIVLALALLAGALAALGEVLRLARVNAQSARDETEAQLLASSVMAELACGARESANVTGAQFEMLESDPPWIYSIAVEPTSYSELVVVRVTVEQQLPPEQQPVRVELQRWFLNPDFVAELSEEAESTSSSGQSSGGGS